MEYKRLELLLMYTVFHIGVYVSLTTVLIGATVFGHINHGLIRWAVICFLVAGACGGTIAANVAHGKLTPDQILKDARLGVLGIPTLPLRPLATVEHLAFWAGILPLVGAFLFCQGAGWVPAK